MGHRIIQRDTVLASLCLLVVLSTAVAIDDYFWHVTDLHYDPTYLTSQDSCNDVIAADKLGQYGDFECDAPWRLCRSAVESMRLIGPQPRFIIWTGDTPAHPKIVDSINETDVLNLLANATQLIKQTFPGVPVYVALGNHDYRPDNQLPPHNCNLYNVTARTLWFDWLGSIEAIETFSRGGYYTKLMPEIGQKVRAVIANTNLYYYRNNETTGLADPAGQFDWMNRTLRMARDNGEQVHLIIHVPPGVMEMEGWKWFKEDYNRKFLWILRTYADVILAVYAGHQHQDTFRLIEGLDGISKLGILIAPAVTPWRARLSTGGRGPAHNPGIRRLYYNTSYPYTVVDIEQYYLPLTEANRIITDPGSTTEAQAWKLLYRYRNSYNIPDVSGNSLYRALSAFKTRDSAQFQSYYTYNSVASTHHSNVPCDCVCKYSHLCPIEHVDYGASDTCSVQAPCKAAYTTIGYRLVVSLLALVEIVLHFKL